MDSMRHLSTSLPPTSTRQLRQQDQPDLLAEFRAAALSVTNLYKTAAASHDKARGAGYQDALDDLLVFLDRENLGLMDGEGWRVRRWATERLSEDFGGGPGGPGGVLKAAAGSDDDEETTAEQGQQRGGSPAAMRKQQQPQPPTMPVSSSELSDDTSPRRTALSEPPQTPLPPSPSVHTQTTVPSIDDFTFRTAYAYPSNHDREAGMDLDPTSSTPTSGEAVRIISRPINVRSRHSAHSNHNRQRVHGSGGAGASAMNFNLGAAGAGVGGKRKIPYPDFFDISGFQGEGKEGGSGPGGGGRGGKRGRFV